MFHDFRAHPPDQSATDLPIDPGLSKEWGEWKRIERKIYSKWWRAAHNLIAHPFLTIYRPWGEWLHAYTANKMYEPRVDVNPTVTDSD
jgi:hypothetical protein